MKIFFSTFVGQHLLMYQQNFRKAFLRDFPKFWNTLEGYGKNKRVLVGFFEILMVTCLAMVKIMEITFPSVIQIFKVNSKNTRIKGTLMQS